MNCTEGICNIAKYRCITSPNIKDFLKLNEMSEIVDNISTGKLLRTDFGLYNRNVVCYCRYYESHRAPLLYDKLRFDDISPLYFNALNIGQLLDL